MDLLSDILTLMRPTVFGFRGLDAAGEWSLRFAAADGIRCFAIEAGTCRMRVGGVHSTTLLGAGDMVLLHGGNEVYLFSCGNAEPVDAYAFLSGVPPGEVATLNGGGECRGVGGFFTIGGPEGGGLLAVVPAVLHVRADPARAALHAGVQRLMRELSEPRPGGALLASHLAQALLIEALRAHLEDEAAGPGWLDALRVPALRRAITAMHGDVGRRWKLRELAAAAGMSRSSFAAHFERVTGQTPIAYLTRWRMLVASDRLAYSNLSLADIAASVGYESQSAFGAAFKRETGRAPRRYRARAAS